MPNHHRPTRADESSHSPGRTPPFAMIPHGLAADPRLDEGKALAVVCALLHWSQGTGRTTVCNDTLAGYANTSADTVKRCLKQLIDLGYLRRDPVAKSKANPTGRVISLLWESDPSLVPQAPPLGHAMRAGSTCTIRTDAPEVGAPLHRPHPARSVHPCTEGRGTGAPRVGAGVHHEEEVLEEKEGQSSVVVVREEMRSASPGWGAQEAPAEVIVEPSAHPHHEAALQAFAPLVDRMTPRTEADIRRLVDEGVPEDVIDAFVLRAMVERDAGRLRGNPIRYALATARRMHAEGGPPAEPRLPILDPSFVRPVAGHHRPSLADVRSREIDEFRRRRKQRRLDLGGVDEAPGAPAGSTRFVDPEAGWD